VLAGPDFFDCTRLGARLRRSICVARQQRTVALGGFHVPAHPECADCAQGMIHAAVVREERPSPRPSPRGRGEKQIRKPRAGRPRPERLNAGTQVCAPETEGVNMEKENPPTAVRMCGDCGVRPATARRDGRTVNGLCGPCTYRRGEAVRRRGGRPTERTQEIRLDLSGYPELWEALQAAAHRELRLMPAQALWILREALSGRGGSAAGTPSQPVEE